MSDAPSSFGAKRVKSSGGAQKQFRKPQLSGARAGVLALGIVLAVASTVAAYLQPLRLDALSSPAPGSLSWWAAPMESNAFTRVPHTTEEPHAVFALAGGQHVWAAGAGGLVLRSTDGGRTWADTALATPNPRAPEAAAKAALDAPAGSSALSLVAQKQAPVNKRPVPETQRTDPKQQYQPQQQTPPPVENNSPAKANEAADIGPVDTPVTPDVSYGVFNSLCFADRDNGWVVGPYALFRTSDGGRTWLPQTIPGRQLFSAIACVDAQTAVITTLNGTIERTTDGGVRWETVDQGSSGLFSVATNGQGVAIAVGDEVALISNDGGRTWRRFAIPSVNLRKVAFTSADHAFAAGAGTILESYDRGVTFTPVSTESPSTNDALVPTGFIASAGTGAGTALIATRELVHRVGANPVSVDSTFTVLTQGSSIWDIAFANDERGWLASGGIHRTDNGGGKWIAQMSTGLLYDLVFSDELYGVAVGEHGLVLTTGDGGQNWKPRSSGTNRRLTEVWQQGATLWASAGNGPSFSSTDGGRSWQPGVAPVRATADSAGSGQRYRALVNVNAASSFALDRNGRLLQRANGGAWLPIEPPHSRWPAPWYYLALILATGVSAAAFRRNAPPEQRNSIADVLVSDRPWRPRSGDRDALGFRDVARGIAQFLANRRTQPPLTIAIIGAWGTGKSSLMNMLQHNLRRRKFRPIWFNAWHHQREDNLLAAIFEGIRQQGIPRIWSLRGVVFRTKLLWSRIRNYPLHASLLLALFVFALGVFLNDPTALINSLKPSDGGSFNWSDSITSLVSLVGGGVTIMAAFIRMKPFGKRPADLVNQMRRLGGLTSRAADTGFRYAFARDFREVADALKPHPMVIFIDDLDRCKPDQVMEVLEAINFLQTCGDVVIVLGMDRERVIGCVGLAYQDVATALNSHNLEADLDQDGEISTEESRINYAQQYLEKLINIEVPVPTATVDGLGRVVSNRALEPDLGEDIEWAPAAPWVARAGRLAQAALIVLAFSSLFWIGLRAGHGNHGHGDAEAAAAAVRDSGLVALDDVKASSDSLPVIAQSEQPALVSERTAGTMPLPIAFLPMLLLGGVLFYAARPRSEVIVDDSETFRGALDLWSPTLFKRLSTPRSAKKFMNRVRFLAMLQRAPSAPASLPQRILRWASLRQHERLTRFLQGLGIEEPAALPTRDGGIPEDRLVSLCVIRETQPAWIEEPGFWDENFGAFLERKREHLPREVVAQLAAFREWGALTEYEDKFADLQSSVRIH